MSLLLNTLPRTTGRMAEVRRTHKQRQTQTDRQTDRGRLETQAQMHLNPVIATQCVKVTLVVVVAMSNTGINTNLPRPHERLFELKAGRDVPRQGQ